MGKHKHHANNAYEPIVTAAFKERLERAWEADERFIVEPVLVALCSSRGKVDDLDCMLDTRYSQLIDNKRKEDMQTHMREL